MYLHEAIKARTADTPYIARANWRDEISPWKHLNIRILPTNSPDCCIILSHSRKQDFSRGWEPTAEDLTADDWIVVR